MGDSIHLLTGYEGYSTFIVPKVPTIFRGYAEDNSWYRVDIENAITQVFYYTEQLGNSNF